jgi:hypothetical protein
MMKKLGAWGKVTAPEVRNIGRKEYLPNTAPLFEKQQLRFRVIILSIPAISDFRKMIYFTGETKLVT